MSSSMPIPARGTRNGHDMGSAISPTFGSAMSSWSPSSPAGWLNSAPRPLSGEHHTFAKGKEPISPSAGSPPDRDSALFGQRRPSLMGSSLSKSEHTVVHLGVSNGAPRLVTCVKSSQGFDWNQELFLPSYADYESHDLEHWQEPVQEIVLTEEEAAAMLPQ